MNASEINTPDSNLKTTDNSANTAKITEIENSNSDKQTNKTDHSQPKELLTLKTWFLQKPLKVRIILVSLLSIFTITISLCGWGAYQVYKIEKIPFAYPKADPSSKKVWLIVGSDSRKYSHLYKAGQTVGERADLIYVAKKQGDKIVVASIPRDIDVDYKGTPNRLALMLWVSPLKLEKSLCNDLQIPVGHMIIVTMDTIDQLVSAVGGIPLDLPYPYRDKDAHISLEAGKHLLNGDQTIAYVRSRHPEFIVDGKWQEEDLAAGAKSRISHSQYVIKQLRNQLARTYNPFTWAKLINGITSNIRLDDMTSVFEIKELMSGKVEMTTIDVEPVSADKLHYKLTPKGIKQLEELGFRQKCKM